MATLNSCRGEMRAIINELRSIEWGIRNEFSGIGQDLAADCVNRVADKYDFVLRLLERVDTNLIAEWVLDE